MNFMMLNNHKNNDNIYDDDQSHLIIKLARGPGLHSGGAAPRRAGRGAARRGAPQPRLPRRPPCALLLGWCVPAMCACE